MNAELGKTYTDKITGFTGVAEARTEWLFGCIRVSLVARTLNSDGKTVNHWFDEAQLDEQPLPAIEGPGQRVATPATPVGGPPRDDPQRREGENR